MQLEHAGRHTCWMVLVFCMSLVLLGIAPMVMAQGAPGGDPAFVPSGAQLELLVKGDDLGIVFTEGAAVGCDGKVYFSDITFSGSPKSKTSRGGILAGVIWVYDPEAKQTRVFRSPSGMSNGIKFDAACNMVHAEGADYGGRRIIRTNMQTGVAEIVTGLYEGRPYNAPNDISIDEKGRIYFSDPRYLGHEEVMQATMAVYRVDPDGSVHRVITDAGKPNGVARFSRPEDAVCGEQ